MGSELDVVLDAETARTPCLSYSLGCREKRRASGSCAHCPSVSVAPQGPQSLAHRRAYPQNTRQRLRTMSVYIYIYTHEYIIQTTTSSREGRDSGRRQFQQSDHAMIVKDAIGISSKPHISQTPVVLYVWPKPPQLFKKVPKNPFLSLCKAEATLRQGAPNYSLALGITLEAPSFYFCWQYVLTLHV